MGRLLLVALVLGGLLLGCDDGSPMPRDPALQAAIRKQLHIADGESPTLEMLAAMESLEARDAGIRNLKGIEVCQGLRWVNLGFQHRDDLSMTLIGVESLSKLPNLERLDLSGNELRRIPSFENNSKLKTLDLGASYFRDLSFVGRLPNLESLSLAACYHLNLETIGQSDSLLYLNLPSRTVTGFDCFTRLKNLEELAISPIGDYDAAYLLSLAAQPPLEDVPVNRLDITPLAKLKQIRTLHLVGVGVTNIRPLSALPNLKLLDVRWNGPVNGADDPWVSDLDSFFVDPPP